MKESQKISVVIAAFNEEPRIGRVLAIATKHPLIDEVIVVNDGSTDNTSRIVKKFKNVRLVENDKNIGKTLTVKKGIEAAKNNLIMLLDADLVGLKRDSLTRLVKPVLDNEVDWTLSMRKNSFFLLKWLKIDLMSGERVVPKKLLQDPTIWSHPKIGYGVECLMNKSLMSKNKTFLSIYWPNVSNINKSQKHNNGFISGWVKNIQMIQQITKAIPTHEFYGQMIKMSVLNHRYSKKISNTTDSRQVRH